MSPAYIAALEYLQAWTLILFGMSIGFLVCQIVQPMPRRFGIIMFVALMAMALWLRHYGADVILVKP